MTIPILPAHLYIFFLPQPQYPTPLPQRVQHAKTYLLWQGENEVVDKKE